jgi:hypothetical protein
MFDMDNSVWEERLRQIEAMPDGPEKDLALEQLTRDYPGLAESLRSDVAFGEEMAMTPMPKGGVAGPASNPFAVYVAGSPLEHAAAGAQKFMGHRERKGARDELDALSAQKQDATDALMRAAIRGGPSGGQPPGGGWMDEDEWERRYGRRRRA